MRVTGHHLLATTDVFLAWEGERPIATLSLVKDTTAGLPCEVLFPLEAERRRRTGRRLGEASSLALAGTRLPRKAVLIGLMRLLAQAARRAGLDEVLATVHPRHASFYEHVLCFEAFGSLTPHPRLRNRPARGLSLSFPRVDRLRPRSYELFFGARLPESAFAARVVSEAERSALRPIAAICDPQSRAFVAVRSVRHAA